MKFEMKIFQQKKVKKALNALFEHIQKHTLRDAPVDEAFSRIRDVILDGYELLEHNEFGVAIDNVASNLYEYHIIMDKEGLKKLKLASELLPMEENWYILLKNVRDESIST